MSSAVVPGNLPLTRLPDDLSLEIFSYLSPAALGLCCQVNSKWRRLASNNLVWREWGRQQFGQYLNVSNVKEFLRECHSQKLGSNDEIVTRIQDFANRISMGHNGRFRCIIGTGRDYRVISVEIKGDRTKLHPVFGAPQDRENDAREFDIKDTAYSHQIGRGDLTDPEPLETRWVAGPITQTTLHPSGERVNSIIPGYRTDGWDKLLGVKEQIWSYTQNPFCVVLRFPRLSRSNIDFDTWVHFNNLEHPTQMHQKIANILQRKVVSLNAQNDREQNKRIFVIGAAAILLLSFVMQMYLISGSSEEQSSL